MCRYIWVYLMRWFALGLINGTGRGIVATIPIDFAANHKHESIFGADERWSVLL